MAHVSRRARRDALVFLAFVAPNFLLLAVFTFWPVLYSLYLSFLKWNMVAKTRPFIGLANYQTMLSDGVFWLVVRNTFVLAAGTVFVKLAIALALAVALNRKMRGRSLYRAVIFSPTFTTSVAVAMVWSWILDPNYGLLRVFLNAVGLAVAQLARRRALGPARRDDRRDLEQPRLRHGDLSRGPPGNPDGALRGGAGRRGLAGPGVLEDHLSAAVAYHLLPADHLRDRSPQGL